MTFPNMEKCQRSRIDLLFHQYNVLVNPNALKVL